MLNNLQGKALRTFENNLVYFEKKQKNVYDKLAALNWALEQNAYQSRYDLILEESYFEVIELSSKTKLYNSDSFAYGDIVRESVNYKKNENVFETFKRVHLNEKNDEHIDIYEILNYINTYKAKSDTLNSLDKFIFFGAGLGTHISKVNEKIKASSYLIIEDDLELFKLSLFVTPYYEIAKNSKLFFSVFESNDEFKTVSQQFINHSFHLNHYIKYFHMLSHGEEKIKEFHLRVISQSHNIFFYKSILDQYLKPLDYIKEGYKFLNMLHSYKGSSLDTKPVLLLGAGPSLKINMEWLNKNQNSFVVVAISSTLNILQAHAIQPDIVIHMDGFESSGAHFTKLENFEFLSKSIFFFSARTPQSIIKLLNKDKIFFYENGTSYKIGLGNLSAACVGSTSYLLLLGGLKVSALYLLGLDLALDSQSGETHSKGHEYAQKLDLSSHELHNDAMEFKKTVLKVQGNFDPFVYTTPEWLLSIDSIHTSSTSFKEPSQNIYNLSKGAFFKNTIPTPLESLQMDTLMDKDKLNAELFDSFNFACSQNLGKDEKTLLQSKLKKAKKLQKILSNHQEPRNSDVFLKTLPALFTELSGDTSQSGYDISLILQEYFKFIYTNIFDFFNTQGLSQKDLHAKEINASLVKALQRIVRVYIKALEAVL
ncbi:DUF115 domain-containing protein [bacterium]|nr:DUF115 domain-containing protein [bacterium]MBU1994477.1 DUF115 domain-containing protein [bacterium]